MITNARVDFFPLSLSVLEVFSEPFGDTSTAKAEDKNHGEESKGQQYEVILMRRVGYLE